jgi:hypothetical protein
MMKTFLLCWILLQLAPAQDKPAAPALAASQKWTIQYFFDEMKQEMEITDLAFPTAERGIAVGAIYDKVSGREKDVALLTSDGGQHWALQPLKDYPDLEEAERTAQAGQESRAGDDHRAAAAGLVSR